MLNVYVIGTFSRILDMKGKLEISCFVSQSLKYQGSV